jgi:hypothetical protein
VDFTGGNTNLELKTENVMKKLVVMAGLLTAFLVSQWFEGGSHFCRYDNGTVLNVGVRLCPLSI